MCEMNYSIECGHDPRTGAKRVTLVLRNARTGERVDACLAFRSAAEVAQFASALQGIAKAYMNAPAREREERGLIRHLPDPAMPYYGEALQ